MHNQRFMNIQRYSLIWRSLHWLSAVVILWAIASGFYLALFDVSDATHHWIADTNVATTLVFIPFFTLRMLIAWHSEKPETKNLSPQQQQLAHRGHQLIYLAVICVLISGVLMMERPMPFFGIAEFPALLEKGNLTQFFFWFHRCSNIALTLLVLAHLAAVVKHQLAGVPVLRKMV